MTSNTMFFLLLAVCNAAILYWGLRVLPGEHMQILASVPLFHRNDGLWQGVNLTWYGVLQAVAITFALALTLVLASSAGVPALSISLTLAAVLAAALPAASLVARLVERRRGTLTVGGAVFVSTLLVPWVALAVDGLLGGEHALATVAAMAVAYPIGEGIGRLACISFGCCYGRRLADCGPQLRALLGWRPAVVVGATRKAAYAGHCEGEPLLPVPALSAVLLSVAGLAGVPLYLAGSFRAAIALSLAVAFLWRFASEFLRADYRGEGRLSAYQWMALGCLVYSEVAVMLVGCQDATPDIQLGLPVLASPIALLALALLGAIVFVHFGVSRVTGASIRLEMRDP